jgi:hypothetical protein
VVVRFHSTMNPSRQSMEVLMDNPPAIQGALCTFTGIPIKLKWLGLGCQRV